MQINLGSRGVWGEQGKWSNYGKKKVKKEGIVYAYIG